jgi:hypothetical protein
MPNPYLNEPNEDTLRTIDEKFAPVGDDRFIYSLQQKKWKPEDIHGFISKLQISYEYTELEYKRILKLKDTYNLDYPSDHKLYFDTAIKLMNKIHSTLASYNNIINGFNPKKKRGKKYKNDIKSHDRTALFKGAYSKDMFGWDPYDERSVQNLYKDLNDYLILANNVLKTCLDIIDEEKAIRSDPELAYPLYENSYNRSVNNNRKLIESIDKANVNIDNCIVKAMEEAEDVKKLIASMFHEINHADFNFFCACKKISDGRKAGLTPDELIAFGKENAEKAFRLRTLLDHIMELTEQRDDVIGWKGMLAGKFVMHLLFWCGWDGRKNENMLRCISMPCTGIIGVVKMGAVMTEKRKLINIDNKEIMKQQSAFNQEMDAFVDSFSKESPQETN